MNLGSPQALYDVSSRSHSTHLRRFPMGRKSTTHPSLLLWPLRPPLIGHPTQTLSYRVRETVSRARSHNPLTCTSLAKDTCILKLSNLPCKQHGDRRLLRRRPPHDSDTMDHGCLATPHREATIQPACTSFCRWRRPGRKPCT